MSRLLNLRTFNYRCSPLKRMLRLASFIAVICFFSISAIASPLALNDADALLAESYKIRSSNPSKSKTILEQLERAELSLAQQDRYDFIQAYSLFINGKVNESIVAFKDLAENGTSANERFSANASLVNLYAGTQNWSEGFKALEFIEDNIQSVDSIDAQEQAHMGAINFYNLIDESEILVEYAKPLLNGQYSLRFTCSASLQWLGAAKELNYRTLSDATFISHINRCRDLNEPIINLALFHEFASFKQDTGDTSRALKILNSHLDEVKTLSYQPLSMAFYETLCRSYFAKNDYAKATSYASLVVNGETSSFLSGESVSAYETLFKIAETQGRYKEALEYYKNIQMLGR